jgi:hypothetical protein
VAYDFPMGKLMLQREERLVLQTSLIADNWWPCRLHTSHCLFKLDWTSSRYHPSPANSWVSSSVP